jgi:membrane-associated HD superfamily phosphohydrolase
LVSSPDNCVVLASSPELAPKDVKLSSSSLELLLKLLLLLLRGNTRNRCEVELLETELPVPVAFSSTVVETFLSTRIAWALISFFLIEMLCTLTCWTEETLLKEELLLSISSSSSSSKSLLETFEELRQKLFEELFISSSSSSSSKLLPETFEKLLEELREKLPEELLVELLWKVVVLNEVPWSEVAPPMRVDEDCDCEAAKALDDADESV